MGHKNTNEFMKIRGAIISTIVNSNQKEVRIPSLRKLAEFYRVSPPTAMRAIHSLLEDGYIVLLKGGGYRSISHTCNSMKTFGIISSNGNQIYDVLCFWGLNSVLGINLTRRNPKFCTKNLYLENKTDLRRAILQYGLAGLICSGGSEEIMNEIVHLQRETQIPAVSFYTSTRKMTTTAPLAEDFYNLLQLLLRETRTKYLLLLAESHPFRHEIEEAIQKILLLNSVEITVVTGPEPDLLPQIRKLYQNNPHFEAVLFFSLLPEIYEFISKHENPSECRFVLDQFSNYRDLRFTGYEYTTNLEHAAEEVISELLEQLKGNKDKRFIRMEFTVNQYENGNFLKQIKQG